MNKKQPEKVNERWRAPDSVTIIQPDNANSSLIFMQRIATYKKKCKHLFEFLLKFSVALSQSGHPNSQTKTSDETFLLHNRM